MERLKKVFNKEFNINQLNINKEQRALIIKVWANHFNKVEPKGVCTGRLRDMIRQLYKEWLLIQANKPTVKDKIEAIEVINKVTEPKKAKKKRKSNKKKR